MDLTKLFEALYTKLLLRDFFAKIVPGSVVLAAILIPELNLSATPSKTEAIEKLLSTVPLYLWAIAAGLAWITGFAVQSVGEFCRAIRYFPKTVTRDQVYRQRVRFDALASHEDKQRLERYVVIKEACGNGYVGLAIALLYGLASEPCRLTAIVSDNWAVILLSVLATIFLARMHFEHVERQHRVMSAVLDVKSDNSVQPAEEAIGS